ncbi:hypothetical protein CTAYLR_003074 [Chrysophaeum taylorii]|uniref:Pectin acetylesterase n=1 Tax=Chrysophaeum taylorii TaxID=2483200 RepID=A0AAD7U5U2_9STRA|nr:hypothetical protein CTAYLR_003074 [Chrysophaeum taylorii]
MKGLDGGVGASLGSSSELMLQLVQSSKIFEVMRGPIIPGRRASSYGECAWGETESCALSSLGNVTRISTGDKFPETQCIFGDPYYFDVHKGGDGSKLMVYFQGGGACWDFASVEYTRIMEKIDISLASCHPTIYSDPGAEGIFGSNDENPFLDYTIVQVGYCSGDVHFGDVTRYGVTQAGYKNAMAVLSWVVEQQASNELPETIDELVIAGSSAGSMGAQLWAKNVTQLIPAEHVTLLFDSYVGVFPPEDEGRTFQGYGMCPYLVTSELRDVCDAGNLSLQMVTKTQLDEIPEARAAFIQAKNDSVQTVFYDAVLFTDDPALAAACVLKRECRDDAIDPSTFYANTQSILEYYNVSSDRAGGDAVTFFVNSDHHIYFTADEHFYNTTTRGTSLSYFGTLAPWIASLLPSSANLTREQCYGALAQPSTSSGLDYCDTNLAERLTPPPPS